MRVRATLRLRNEHVLAAMRERRWSQRDLAIQAGVSVSAVGSAVNLRFGELGQRGAARIADALRLPVELVRPPMVRDRVENEAVVLELGRRGWSARRLAAEAKVCLSMAYNALYSHFDRLGKGSARRIAAALGLDEHQVRPAWAAVAYERVIDIEVERLTGSPVQLVAAADDLVEREETRQIVHAMIGRLPLRERTVINARYGLNGGSATLMEVARRMGCTHERVRQIQLNGERRLRLLVEHECPDLLESGG